eukprot:6491617-Lingulodinium_polyedra.AAC.1
MDCTWTVHGHPMDNPCGQPMHNTLIAHGLSIDSPWAVHGQSVDIPWTVHGQSMDCPWTVHGGPSVD